MHAPRSLRWPRRLPRATGASITAIAALALLGGCGTDAQHDGHDASTTGAAGETQQITVTVAGGEVSPAPQEHEVALGSTLTVTVTDDEADELHVHGYDEEVELEPGKAASVTFTADIPGVFEAELHHSGTVLFELKVE